MKGAYDNKFKLEKVRTGGAIEAQTVYYKSYFDTNGTMSQTDPDYDKSLIYVPSGSDTPLTYSESSGRGQNWYLEGRINYDRTFGDHRISGLFLYNQSRNYYPDSYTYLPRNYVGLVGRATYAYQSKYLLDVNVGYTLFSRGERFLHRFGELCSGQHTFRCIPFLLCRMDRNCREVYGKPENRRLPETQSILGTCR